MVKQKNARVLMQETCWFCQKPLDYDKWIEGNPDEAFGIAYTQPFVKTWMPFYISKRSTTPTFDEDFTLYGYDRLIQVRNATKRSKYRCSKWPFSNFEHRSLWTEQIHRKFILVINVMVILVIPDFESLRILGGLCIQIRQDRPLLYFLTVYF